MSLNLKGSFFIVLANFFLNHSSGEYYCIDIETGCKNMEELRLKSLWIENGALTVIFRHEYGKQEKAMQEIRTSFNDYDVHFIRGNDDRTHPCMIAHQKSCGINKSRRTMQ